MKQYGCQRCMGKQEEEKWYPLEKEEKYCFEEEEEKMYFEEKFEYEPKRPEKGCRCQGKERKEEKMCFEEKFECQPKRTEKECGCRGKEEKYKVIVEPTVYCKEEKTFRHCVKHIVPVVCKEIENHHYDHEYVIEKKVIKEQNRYDHGRRNEDWCKLAGCGRARKDDCDCE
ncbi:MAG: hypothetical protein II005_02085 [Turicibacter sp.]|nr:hypothetical protein [Turicibacter sp.]